jgi:hypothetical protein
MQVLQYVCCLTTVQTPLLSVKDLAFARCQRLLNSVAKYHDRQLPFLSTAAAALSHLQLHHVGDSF